LGFWGAIWLILRSVTYCCFERLRAVRKRLADAEGVPAYIVFGDAALRAMAESRPRTADELLAVPGVGQKKLERYGEAFLEALREG
jgi:ATP-dependent DNA helicase RecQ